MTGPWNNKTLFHPLQLPWEPSVAAQLPNCLPHFPLPGTRGELLRAGRLIGLGNPVLAKCLNHKSQFQFLCQGWAEKSRVRGRGQMCGESWLQPRPHGTSSGPERASPQVLGSGPSSVTRGDAVFDSQRFTRTQ